MGTQMRGGLRTAYDGRPWMKPPERFKPCEASHTCSQASDAVASAAMNLAGLPRLTGKVFWLFSDYRQQLSPARTEPGRLVIHFSSNRSSTTIACDATMAKATI